MKNFLLWASIIPVSVLCCIFIPEIYKRIVSLIISPDNYISIYVSDLAPLFFQGGLFVMQSFLLAPKYKIQTALIMYIAFIFINIIGEYYLQQHNNGIGYFYIFIRILGATVMFFSMKNSD